MRAKKKVRRRGLIVLWTIILISAVIALVFVIKLNWMPSIPTENFEAAVIDESRPFALLVNKRFRLSKDYVPDGLVEVNVRFASNVKNERRQMQTEAAAALERMFDAATAKGLDLVAVSGYRSYKTQKGIYEARLRQADYDYVSMYVAQAGASEHQTGLAMDVGQGSNPQLEE